MIVTYYNFNTSVKLYISCFPVKLTVVFDVCFFLSWECVGSEMGDSKRKYDGPPSFYTSLSLTITINQILLYT